MPTNTEEYDLALYGAAGFTGRQAAEYLSLHAPPGLRWAIVGRSRSRLAAVRASLPGPAYPVEILVADSSDAKSVDAVVRRSRVVLSTAGPFALYGTPVVDACVRFGTHYVDITGEIAWIRQLISKYHAQAAAEGTRVIPCCGFDSVPSDIGTLLVVRKVAQGFGISCREVRAYFQVRGGFNGGTVASALNEAKSKSRDQFNDTFLLDPPGSHSEGQVQRSKDLTWSKYDPLLKAWTGPFFMAPNNTRVVRRSAALHALWGEPYGKDFVYQEAMKFDPPLARTKAVSVTLGLAAFGHLLKWSVTRRMMALALPKPGEGPSQSTIDKGWFRCELIGIAWDGRQVRGAIRHAGDPGNRATAKFACESALALCAGAEALPGGPERGGVLTPATGLGLGFVERLRGAGVAIELSESERLLGVA